MMCDVPSMTVFVGNPLSVVLVLFPDIIIIIIIIIINAFYIDVKEVFTIYGVVLDYSVVYLMKLSVTHII
jgi:hypothetical protein